MDYWDELLMKLPDSYKKWFEEEKKYLIKNIKKDSKVLDIGCGNGRSMNDLFPITKTITGIDHDKIVVNESIKRFNLYKGIKILLAEASDLPFEKDSFDFIISLGVFHNFADKKFRILEEMKMVLKENGKIIISTYSEKALPERMKIYKKLKIPIKKIDEDGTVTFDESLGDNISEQFSEKELRDIFKKAKLKVEEIKGVGIVYFCKLTK